MQMTCSAQLFSLSQQCVGVSVCDAALAVVAVEPELTDSLVLTMKEYLDANWFDAIDLGSYAKSLDVSLKTASRRFKKAVGMSLKQYQQAKRIDEAKLLLTTSTWSLKDIGYECGFYDLPQFSRLFKASVGQTPSRYRKEQKSLPIEEPSELFFN